MRDNLRQSLRAAVVIPIVAMAVGACETAPPTRTSSITTVTTPAVDPTTVNYPDGTYKLYGDGSTTPYYWVWIPKGSATAVLPPAPPPVISRGVVVSQPGVVVTQPAVATQPAVTVQTGRYQLYGDGASTPYYWAWIPSGVVAPPPPPLPTRP